MSHLESVPSGGYTVNTTQSELMAKPKRNSFRVVISTVYERTNLILTKLKFQSRPESRPNFILLFIEKKYENFTVALNKDSNLNTCEYSLNERFDYFLFP